jgi:hypothetical protein
LKSSAYARIVYFKYRQCTLHNLIEVLTSRPLNYILVCNTQGGNVNKQKIEKLLKAAGFEKHSGYSGPHSQDSFLSNLR